MHLLEFAHIIPAFCLLLLYFISYSNNSCFCILLAIPIILSAIMNAYLYIFVVVYQYTHVVTIQVPLIEYLCSLINKTVILA